MQEHFVDKINFFKFLSMSDKPRLHQLKIFNSSTRRFSDWLNLSSRIGKYHQERGNTLRHELIKHAKMSYSVVSLVFRKFSCGTYQNDLNRGTSKLRHSKYLKKYEPC